MLILAEVGRPIDETLSDAELDTQLQALWERQASLIGQGCEEEMDGLFEDTTVDLRCITEGLCGIAVADGDDDEQAQESLEFEAQQKGCKFQIQQRARTVNTLKSLESSDDEDDEMQEDQAQGQGTGHTAVLGKKTQAFHGTGCTHLLDLADELLVRVLDTDQNEKAIHAWMAFSLVCRASHRLVQDCKNKIANEQKLEELSAGFQNLSTDCTEHDRHEQDVLQQDLLHCKKQQEKLLIDQRIMRLYERNVLQLTAFSASIEEAWKDVDAKDLEEEQKNDIVEQHMQKLLKQYPGLEDFIQQSVLHDDQAFSLSLDECKQICQQVEPAVLKPSVLKAMGMEEDVTARGELARMMEKAPRLLRPFSNRKPASATAGDARSGIDAVGRGARESSELDTKKRKILKAKRVFGGLVGVETVQN